MHALGAILMMASMVAGTLAAATAYLAPLSLPDEQLVGLMLNAPAGGQAGGAGPRAAAGSKLTRPVLARLRADRVRYVRVKQFWPDGRALPIWPGKWYFLVSMLGVIVGARMIRLGARRTLAAAGGAPGAVSAGEAIASMRTAIEELIRQRSSSSDESQRLRATVDRLSDLQRGAMQSFVESRALLVARLGMGGYARLMDPYAAAERQINRAWSAAVDSVDIEVAHCLDRARELLAQAEQLVA